MISIYQKRNTFLAAAFLLAVTSSVCVQRADAQGLQVGAAKVDITPDKSELESATDIIRDHLYIRAIYINDGKNCAVLASIDAGGVGNNILDIALPKSSASTGCPITNYVVSATHTHSSGSGRSGTEKIAAALVSAIDQAKSRLEPARIGYGTTEVDLNVNRDHYNSWLEWRQEPNPEGVSDKTLAVLEFLGKDDVPIAVYMNYGMHPVNFYRSGVISADFPGDAAHYVEDLFGDRTVALFSQAASGDQNPKLAYSPIFREGPVKAVMPPHQPPNRGTQGQVTPQAATQTPATPRTGPAPEQRATNPPGLPAITTPIIPNKKIVERKNEYVRMLGTEIGSSTVKTMLYEIEPKEEALIWAGQQNIICPGRTRIDNTGREDYDPGYEKGPDVTIKVGLLRIGDIYIVTVNGEVYTEISQRLKAKSPAAKTMLVTLANGSANSGYIYSDNASTHKTFQVIGSRLMPGCAEESIVSAALDLMKQAGR